MTKLKFILIILIALSFSCSEESVTPGYISTGIYSGEYFPTTEWRYCSPEEVGVNPEALSAVHSYISDPNYGTDGYLIIKNGYIISEDYFNDFTKDKKHASFSIAKSFTSAIIGIAIDQNYINSDEDKISQYYTVLDQESVQQWKKDITISNLLTMTSGIEWSEDGLLENDLFQLTQSDNFVQYVLNKSVLVEPGTVWSYNSGESMLLSGIINITAGKSMFEYAQHNLFDAIGIKELYWVSDTENQTLAGWGISTTMYNYARFGYLFLNEGNWDGDQVISQEWIHKSTTPFRAQTPYYGYLWWLGEEAFFGSSVDLPDDIFMAIGAFGQYIIIIPSENLVIVRLGQDLYSENSWKPEEFIRLILNAL